MTRFHYEEHHSGRAARCGEAIASGAGELLAAFRHCGPHHSDFERAGHRHIAAGHLPELRIDTHVPCVQRAFQVRGNHCPVARSIGGFGIVFTASVDIEVERERTGCLPPIRCIGRVPGAPPTAVPIEPNPYPYDGSDRVPVAPPIVVPAQPDFCGNNGRNPMPGDGNAPRPGDAPVPVAQRPETVRNDDGSEVTIAGGHVTRIKDKTGRVIELGRFDAAGNPTEFTLPGEQAGQPQTWLKANDGKWHRLEYDARRREFVIGPRTWEGSISADQHGNFTMVSADGHHRITRQGDGRSVHAETGADGKERVMRVVNGSESSQDFLYDRNGNMNCIRTRNARGMVCETLTREADGAWHQRDLTGREIGKFKDVTVDGNGNVVTRPVDVLAPLVGDSSKGEAGKGATATDAKHELDKIAQHLTRAAELGNAKDIDGALKEFSLAMAEADRCSVDACSKRIREIKELWEKETDPEKLRKLGKEREDVEELRSAHFDVRVALARFLDRNNQPELALVILDGALRVGVVPDNNKRTLVDLSTPEEVKRLETSEEWQALKKSVGGEIPYCDRKEYMAQRFRKELRDKVAGKK